MQMLTPSITEWFDEQENPVNHKSFAVKLNATKQLWEIIAPSTTIGTQIEIEQTGFGEMPFFSPESHRLLESVIVDT